MQEQRLRKIMAVYTDTFTSDLGWVKTGSSYVDASASVSGGALTITKGAGGYKTSGYTRSLLVGLNAVIKVRTSGGTNGSPHIRLRETDQDNFLMCQFDRGAAKFAIGKVVAGTYTELASLAVTNYTSALNYTFSALVFGNCFHASFWNEAAGKLLELEIISSDISAFTGTRHGLGHGYSGAGTTAAFSSVEMRSLDTMDNVVCLGNSNVNTQAMTDLGGGAWSRIYDDDNGFPMIMQRQRLGSGMIVRAKGVSGIVMSTVIANLATTLDPYKITGARNIVVLSCGNNNFTNEDDTGAECYAEMQTWLTAVKTSGWEPFICSIIPFDWTPSSQDFVDELSSYIRTQAPVDGYTCIDIWLAFGCDSGNPDTNPTTLRGADGIHYTASGKDLAASTVLRAIARNDRNTI